MFFLTVWGLTKVRLLLSSIFLLVFVVLSATANDELLALGHKNLPYDLEPPGSYQLYSIGDAADGTVLDLDGETQHLHQLFDDKIVVLGFIYLSCNDVNGCPLTTLVIKQVTQALEALPQLKKQVRFLSVSFDPERDTPEYLDLHTDHIGADNEHWSLLTTENQDMLAPILQSYNQGIQKMYDSKGNPTGEINHVLRVYLIDKQKKIRNIYSTTFLHQAILLNDIKTLAME